LTRPNSRKVKHNKNSLYQEVWFLHRFIDFTTSNEYAFWLIVQIWENRYAVMIANAYSKILCCRLNEHSFASKANRRRPHKTAKNQLFHPCPHWFNSPSPHVRAYRIRSFLHQKVRTSAS